MQWSDAVSLQFLSYLGRRLEELPVGLLLGLRTGEPVVAEVDFDAVAELASERVEPALLSPAAVAELLEEAFGVPPEAGFVEACHHATGGNPLLLREH